MVHEREPVSAELSQLVDEIRSGLPDQVAGMSQAEFDRLCQNIARAMLRAIQAHETRLHQQSPEYGEPAD